jgi:hypothetical protein
MDTEKTMIAECFSETIMNLLENQETDVYLREHYVDSPNYFANDHSSLQEMLETMLWLTRSEKDKKDILDKELLQYMTPNKSKVLVEEADEEARDTSESDSDQSDSLSDPGFPEEGDDLCEDDVGR